MSRLHLLRELYIRIVGIILILLPNSSVLRVPAMNLGNFYLPFLKKWIYMVLETKAVLSKVFALGFLPKISKREYSSMVELM